MNYENTIYFAETWGLILLIVLFLAGVAYALWPSNHSKFDHAAHLPLDDTEETQNETRNETRNETQGKGVRHE